jgi:hypothetical protein
MDFDAREKLCRKWIWPSGERKPTGSALAFTMIQDPIVSKNELFSKCLRQVSMV